MRRKSTEDRMLEKREREGERRERGGRYKGEK